MFDNLASFKWKKVIDVLCFEMKPLTLVVLPCEFSAFYAVISLAVTEVFYWLVRFPLTGRFRS